MTHVRSAMGRRPSLRRRLLAQHAAACGRPGHAARGWRDVPDKNVIETTHDRLLDGSMLAIDERLAVDEDNEATVDLPPVALGMLESQAGNRLPKPGMPASRWSGACWGHWRCPRRHRWA